MLTRDMGVTAASPGSSPDDESVQDRNPSPIKGSSTRRSRLPRMAVPLLK